MRNVPLGWQDEVVVTNLFEVTLLPSASVHEGNVALCEGHKRIGMRKISENRCPVHPWVPDDICHPRLFPSIVDLGMTRAARHGSDIISRRALVGSSLRCIAIRADKPRNNGDLRPASAHCKNSWE